MYLNNRHNIYIETLPQSKPVETPGRRATGLKGATMAIQCQPGRQRIKYSGGFFDS